MLIGARQNGSPFAWGLLRLNTTHIAVRVIGPTCTYRHTTSIVAHSYRVSQVLHFLLLYIPVLHFSPSDFYRAMIRRVRYCCGKLSVHPSVCNGVRFGRWCKVHGGHFEHMM